MPLLKRDAKTTTEAYFSPFSDADRGVHDGGQHIFDKIALADNVQYLVRASYLEIYNEEIRDLLAKVIDMVKRKQYAVFPPSQILASTLKAARNCDCVKLPSALVSLPREPPTLLLSPHLECYVLPLPRRQPYLTKPWVSCAWVAVTTLFYCLAPPPKKTWHSWIIAEE